MSLTNNKKFYNSLVKKMQINDGDIVEMSRKDGVVSLKILERNL